ncbi:MAG: MgtC/SapB family protein [Clostridiales bacterium]|jgi:putative Mg2+ transporter-C (MgtC) family protein|nr:MgtC/SapB family protein [Clostridiales bacterium]
MNWEMILKLVLAMIFGGLIGLEREIGNRPAGFRTHTLVCMGSVLVMMTSEFMLSIYSSVSVDPARLGAQVISGIGFLGAGTILKDGSRVRGLTTAASLWVVACIGLAIGVGFYWGALIATLLSYITLVFLKKFEGFVPSHRNYEVLLEIPNVPGQISKITNVLSDLNVRVRDIKVDSGDGELTCAFFNLVLPPGIDKLALGAEISRLQGVSILEKEKSEEH